MNLKKLGALRGGVSQTKQNLMTGLQILEQQRQNAEADQAKVREKVEKDFKNNAKYMTPDEAMAYQKKYGVSEQVFDAVRPQIGAEKNVDLRDLERIMNPPKHMFKTQKGDYAITNEGQIIPPEEGVSGDIPTKKDGRIVFAKPPTEQEKEQLLATAKFKTESQRSAMQKAYLPEEEKLVQPNVTIAQYQAALKNTDPKSAESVHTWFTDRGLPKLDVKPEKPKGSADKEYSTQIRRVNGIVDVQEDKMKELSKNKEVFNYVSAVIDQDPSVLDLSGDFLSGLGVGKTAEEKLPEAISELENNPKVQEFIKIYKKYKKALKAREQLFIGGIPLTPQEFNAILKKEAKAETKKKKVEKSKKEGGQLMEDANGNKAIMYPDGSFEEVK